MPHKGYQQSPEHIERRLRSSRETIMAQAADSFFNFIMSFDKEDRDEIIADRLAEMDRIADECERLLAKRRLHRIQNSAGDPQIERIRQELLQNVRALIHSHNGAGSSKKECDCTACRMYEANFGRKDKNSMRDAASTPYVSETQTRHVPITIRHSHDHAAYGAHDHDDGIHSHVHTHEADADHDHPDQHDFGHMRPGRVSGPGEQVPGTSNLYGLEINASSTAQRAALRRARIQNLDQRHGGSA